MRITSEGDTWVMAGTRTRATLRASDLALAVEHAGATWSMVPSKAGDLVVRASGRDVSLRLADASEVDVRPYRTGFRTGVKVTLGGWSAPGGAAPGLRLFLTLGLEGGDEDLVFDVAAEETGATVRRLDWPAALDARAVAYTVLPNVRGALLPRDWPQAYDPIRPPRPADAAHADHSEIQSHVIESWSMSWWGFKKGAAAMMVIVETPDDAAYQFEHPAGGPTVVGPRWRATLG
ncbi:MAG TPA: hypothetical protein VMR21_01700, partial [Vicinamibacteria bacterium]|nr:hypothetical protein [Vicinamibacteria bacterium]